MTGAAQRQQRDEAIKGARAKLELVKGDIAQLELDLDVVNNKW
jgi:hypothetical protein